MQLNNLDSEKIYIRFFFGGTEMKDEVDIYRYRVKNNNQIQVSKRDKQNILNKIEELYFNYIGTFDIFITINFFNF